MGTMHLEFATPIYVTTWGRAKEFKAELREAVLSETAAQQEQKALIRGQEVPLLKTTLESPQTGLSPVTWGRRTKKETGDDLHQRHEQLRPFFLWCLEEYSGFLLALLDGQNLSVWPSIENCWASVYAEGDYHQQHNHPNCAFSGVYCVEQPDVEIPEGTINFLDPRPQVNYYLPEVQIFAGDTRMLSLQPGDLVIFPAWLRHFVNPFRGSGERITISINFDFRDLPVK